MNTSAHGPLDRAGSRGDDAGRELDWPGIDPDFVEAVHRADGRQSLIGLIEARQISWPRRLSTSRDAAIAALAPIASDAKALVLGGNWMGVAPALSYLGATVTRADFVPSRVRFMSLMGHQGSAPALLASHRRLPWSDGRFDAIFVDLVDLERAGIPRDDLDLLLHETHRLLAPGGTAVIAVQNPLEVSWSSWRARHGRLRSAIGVVGEVGLSRLARPWWTLTERARLRVVQVVEPYPTWDEWELLLPPRETGMRLRAEGNGAHAGRAHKLATRLGFGILIAHNQLLMCRPIGERARRRASGAAIADPRAIVRACSDTRAAIESGDEFLKIPLSGRQETEVLDEVDRTVEAASGSWRTVAPPWARIETRSGVIVGVYPRFKATSITLDTYERLLANVLCALPRDTAALGGTELFKRIQLPPVPENLATTPLHRLRTEALALRRRAVPVGPSHGDLDRGNVVALAAGGIRIVDWQRSQTRNPLFIDALTSAVDLERRRSGGSRADVFGVWTTGRLTGHLADLAYSLLGDLTRREACALLLLHEVTSYSFAWDESEPIEPDILKAAELLVDGSINSIP